MSFYSLLLRGSNVSAPLSDVLQGENHAGILHQLR